MPDFRVYYGDETTYTGAVESAPVFGVLCIVERDAEHGRRIVSGGDYYVWIGRWWAVDFIGMIDYLAQPGWKRVLIGRMVDNDIWADTIRRANSDPDFPPRTAYGVFERVING